MLWFYNLKIAKKLILTFLLVIGIVSCISIYSIVQLTKVNQASSDITTNWLPTIQAIANLKLSVSRLRSAEYHHISIQDPKTLNELNIDNGPKLQKLIDNTKKYESLISENEEKLIYNDLYKNIQTFIEDYHAIMKLSQNGDKEGASILINGANSKNYLSMLSQLDKLTSINDSGAIKSQKFASETFYSAKVWIISLLIICLIVSISLAFWISNIIATPLKLALNIAQQVSQGDLTAIISTHSKDETGQLMSALKTMNDNLRNLVSEVRQGTETIATASSQISSGNLDLSRRTEEQASSLEETAAAIEELTSTLKLNSDNTKEAKKKSFTASSFANNSGDMVNDLIKTMASINDSSKKISEITTVIDTIAFQTNILALNAAVEAAHAGTQGRGFAVVATEVKNLAQQSAIAAKEIKDLIADSLSKVNAGSALVDKAGISMKDVVSSVNNVSSIISEISVASEEQSTGIAEVNIAIMQMDQVTQQNAALVEEAAAAALSLEEQAAKLLEAISIFKIK